MLQGEDVSQEQSKNQPSQRNRRISVLKCPIPASSPKVVEALEKLRNKNISYDLIVEELSQDEKYELWILILRKVPGQSRTEMTLRFLASQCFQIEFFKTIMESYGEDVVHNCVRFLRQQDLSAGEILFSQGDEGTRFYILLEGSVNVMIKVPYDGQTKVPEKLRRFKQEVINTLETGKAFGEIALMNDNTTRTATVKANKFCRIAFLEKDDFKRAIGKEAIQSIDQRYLFVKEYHLFEDFTQRELINLSYCFQEIVFHRGEMVFDAYDKNIEDIYFVKEGSFILQGVVNLAIPQTPAIKVNKIERVSDLYVILEKVLFGFEFFNTKAIIKLSNDLASVQDIKTSVQLQDTQSRQAKSPYSIRNSEKGSCIQNQRQNSTSSSSSKLTFQKPCRIGRVVCESIRGVVYKVKASDVDSRLWKEDIREKFESNAQRIFLQQIEKIQIFVQTTTEERNLKEFEQEQQRFIKPAVQYVGKNLSYSQEIFPQSLVAEGGAKGTQLEKQMKKKKNCKDKRTNIKEKPDKLELIYQKSKVKQNKKKNGLLAKKENLQIPKKNKKSEETASFETSDKLELNQSNCFEIVDLVQSCGEEDVCDGIFYYCGERNRDIEESKRLEEATKMFIGEDLEDTKKNKAIRGKTEKDGEEVDDDALLATNLDDFKRRKFQRKLVTEQEQKFQKIFSHDIVQLEKINESSEYNKRVANLFHQNLKADDIIFKKTAQVVKYQNCSFKQVREYFNKLGHRDRFFQDIFIPKTNKNKSCASTSMHVSTDYDIQFTNNHTTSPHLNQSVPTDYNDQFMIHKASTPQPHRKSTPQSRSQSSKRAFKLQLKDKRTPGLNRSVCEEQQDDYFDYLAQKNQPNQLQNDQGDLLKERTNNLETSHLMRETKKSELDISIQSKSQLNSRSKTPYTNQIRSESRYRRYNNANQIDVSTQQTQQCDKINQSGNNSLNSNPLQREQKSQDIQNNESSARTLSMLIQKDKDLNSPYNQKRNISSNFINVVPLSLSQIGDQLTPEQKQKQSLLITEYVGSTQLLGDQNNQKTIDFKNKTQSYDSQCNPQKQNSKQTHRYVNTNQHAPNCNLRSASVHANARRIVENQRSPQKLTCSQFVFPNHFIPPNTNHISSKFKSPFTRIKTYGLFDDYATYIYKTHQFQKQQKLSAQTSSDIFAA